MLLKIKKLKKYSLAALVIMVISLFLAVPVTMLTLEWSRNTAVTLYAGFTKISGLHSPAVTRIDDNGIPLVDYGYQAGDYTGPQRNPLTIAAQAIEYFNEYQNKNDEKIKMYFFNCIEWLEKSKIEKEGYIFWQYEFDLPAYHIKAPWCSAMSQSRIMMAFERAFRLTRDERYLQLANLSLKFLTIPVDKGGVLVIDPDDGGLWFEEAASKTSEKSPLILNGNIFVLLDLHDYYTQTGSQLAKILFEDGIIELKKHLVDYDSGHWTYYDRMGNLAYDYHYTHIEQMQTLYKINGDPVFKEYHDKWSSYFPFNPMWARLRFAAYLLDTALIFVSLFIIFGVIKLVKKKFRRNRLMEIGETN